MKNPEKILIVGAGLTGITLAERFASKSNRVLIIEKRGHIGGNCYDFKNKGGILVHKYGPHIFHTEHKEVWDYLSKFTEWIPYEHKVLGFIDGKFVPIPFNLNSLYELFPKKEAEKIEKKLIKQYGYGRKLPILELRKTQDKDLKFLADFVYQNIYLNYTQKQWGKRPEKMDPSVTARVPVLLSRDDRYFQDKYQGIPKEGYTKMFAKMLNSKNIQIILKTNYNRIIDNNKYDIIFYTGPIDGLFNYKYGKLNYRYLQINIKTLSKNNYQPAAVINYPDLEHPFTRVTEFKKITQQKHKNTTIGIEYPSDEGFMAWPFLDNKKEIIIKKYWREAEKLKKKNIYFAGRLAEFKYYNMDEAVKRSMDLYNRINRNE